MPHDLVLDDAEARRQALDPTQSWVIQAPAGSGKTELLIGRILTLLARVEAPENILAITFTRKAAAEMRARILQALNAACSDEAPVEPHKRQTWELARAALAQDRARGWRLTDNANRLRIMTIDSLCSRLTRQMPWLSRFGAPPRVADEPQLLYREAARRTVAMLEAADDWTPHIARVLRHFDNQVDRVAGMIEEMLGRRDQWLPHIVSMRQRQAQDGQDLRACLEATHAELARAALAAARASLPEALATAFMACARFAAATLAEQGDTTLAGLADRSQWPEAVPDALPEWQLLADFLLTQQGEPRRKVDRRNGFPAESATRNPEVKAQYRQMKTRMLGLLEELAQMPELTGHLQELRELPPVHFQDSQWEVLAALFEVLPMAVAQLITVFAEEGAVDFTEIALRALSALGSEEAPTDLALALDYRLSHILVDEFQDTSLIQLDLLRRLVAGWQPGDGRTVCLLGDPQQSIYRFRAAEVGLFLKVRAEGLGPLQPQPLSLTVNFRSRAGIVDWVNNVFGTVLPASDDAFRGAVSYSASVAAQAAGPDAAVQVHVPADAAPEAEARLVAGLVRDALASRPEGRVAILVRSRSHLAAIMPQLRAAGISFQAVEIEHLAQRPVIQDLLALTRALAHPADRINWLAVLRAPWSGLTLADLLILAGDEGGVLLERMRDPLRRQQLSADGQARLDRVLPALAAGVDTRRQRSLRRWIEGVWLALGGPACIDAAAQADVEVYFDLLEALDVAGRLPEAARLDEALGRLFASPDPSADARVQVLTIHKSKGLEYETVILPGLHRVPPAPSLKILQWCELPGEDVDRQLILAPARSAADRTDALYAWISRIESARERFEMGRLLYVAATRAREVLHLVGHVQRAGEEVQVPRTGTLLDCLWPAVASVFTAAVQSTAGSTAPAAVEVAQEADPAPAGIRRLALDWQLPAEVARALQPAPARCGRIPAWISPVRRHTGTVTHRLLARVAGEGLATWTDTRIDQQREWARAALRQLGVPAPELEAAARQVVANVQRTCHDPRGRWLLEQTQAAACELALTGVDDGRCVHLVLDRTFIDDLGVRWIVDWKTAACEDDTLLDTFLDAEQARYRDQLERYARLMRMLDGSRPVHLGLYFPAHGAWREWAASA